MYFTILICLFFKFTNNKHVQAHVLVLDVQIDDNLDNVFFLESTGTVLEFIASQPYFYKMDKMIISICVLRLFSIYTAILI